VQDEIAGPPGEHLIEQFWHAGERTERIEENRFRIGSATLTLDGIVESELSEGGMYGWRSPAFGVKVAAPVIRAATRSRLPLRLESRLWLGACAAG
jgi:hypothetical protein